MKKSPPGRGRTGCLPCPGRKSGFSGIPWTRSSTPFLVTDAQCSCAADGGTAGGCAPFRRCVIEVPKIIPSRRLVRYAQLAEQLVDVPTPSPAHVPVPRMEDQLVEVPQIVTHIVPQSFFASTDGYVWSQLSGPWGVYWWRCGTSHTQWTPHRGTPPGQGGIEILARGEWTSVRSCSSCSSSPRRTSSPLQFPRQSAGHSSCATEGRFHSAVLEQGC